MLLSLLVFSGCGRKPGETLAEPQESITPDEVEMVVVKKGGLSEKVADFSEVTSYVGDVDADGAEETVVLSTAAERDEKGEFLWNDGQDWALYVRDGGDYYVLFDGFIQAGSAYFDVSDYYMKNGAEPKITLTVTTGAGFAVKTYTFSEKEDGYVEYVAYDTNVVTEAGINRRFSSYPDIVK